MNMYFWNIDGVSVYGHDLWNRLANLVTCILYSIQYNIQADQESWQRTIAVLYTQHTVHPHRSVSYQRIYFLLSGSH